jgi:uncharacterized protein YraI
MKSVRSVAVAGFAAVILFIAPSLAQAAQGFIVSQTELKAGPDDQFPTVVDVQAGAEVNVYGCLTGNSWCDVSFQQDRGWVSGQDLEVMYQNKRVKIVEVTSVEVVPVVTFEVKTYWTQYYASKPFFKDRDRFASINININNGGKAPAGKTGSGGQASTDTTGSISGKVTTGGKADETGGKAPTGGQANASGSEKTGGATATEGAKGQAATENCPAGQKNCKAQDNAGGGNAMGKSASSGGNGDNTMGKKPQAEPIAKGKGCTPGTANCPKGANNGG